MKKNTLIIPDLHHKWEVAEKIIKIVSPDETIFLGDYFDSFDETSSMVSDMADWLVQSVKNPNRIHLFGNHDIHYAYANRYFQCSGYEQWKYFHINDIVKHDTWDKLKHYHVLDNMWLLTHAGLHEYFIPNEIKALVNDKPTMFIKLKEFLDAEIIKGMRNQSWIFQAGYIRSGNQLYGGIDWCDSREFIPTKGLHQIFGHTVHSHIRWKNIYYNQKDQIVHYRWYPPSDNLKNPEHSYNVCIDTGTSHYATWDGTDLKIFWIGDL
jgi:hypothetical protein